MVELLGDLEFPPCHLSSQLLSMVNTNALSLCISWSCAALGGVSFGGFFIQQKLSNQHNLYYFLFQQLLIVFINFCTGFRLKLPFSENPNCSKNVKCAHVKSPCLSHIIFAQQRFRQFPTQFNFKTYTQKSFTNHIWFELLNDTFHM